MFTVLGILSDNTLKTNCFDCSHKIASDIEYFIFLENHELTVLEIFQITSSKYTALTFCIKLI